MSSGIGLILLVFGASCLTTYFLSRPDSPLRVLDRPNDRSLHRVPIPRTGGLGIWAGFALGLIGLFAASPAWVPLLWILGAALLVGAVSFMDDRAQVSVGVRLASHLLAGCMILLAGLGLTALEVPGAVLEVPRTIGFALTLLSVVWMINLYNFMDGMDGFAAGMAVCGFGVLAVLGYLGDNALFALLSGMVAAAAGGFLVWNFPPAKIFMGDSGSSVLGLLAAALSLWGDKLGLFPLWIALLVFSPFIVDATVTLMRRAGRRERLWEAHRMHYYQRLVQLGWGHRKAVLVEYAVMGACGLTAITLIQTPPPVQWAALAAWAVVYVIWFVSIDFHFRRRSGALEE